MSSIGYHLDVALHLLNAGMVFNVTFMEGQPVMMETTRDGKGVTITVRDFMHDPRHAAKFSDVDRAFVESERAIVSREVMHDFAKLVMGEGWDQSIGAEPLHGRIKIGSSNPMRCSLFLFSSQDGAHKQDGLAHDILSAEETAFASGYRGRLGCAVRILPTGPRNLADLGIQQAAKAVADVKGGLVLAVGSPGVGKSTTAAAYIEHVNRTRSGSIVTAENPIEVPIVSDKSVVSQREVGVNVASVAMALRDAERNFAHSALVGEIQTRQDELDTFNAARHGMFVVATSFANNAVDAVKTLASSIDKEGSDGADLVASTVLAVIFQVRLPSTAAGCWEFAYESLVVHDNEEVMDLIRRREWKALQIHVSQDKDSSLNGALANLVRQKKVRREQALVQAYDKREAAQLLGGLE